jgi:hypothetical protein
MKVSSLFVLVMATASIAVLSSGCGTSGPAPQGLSQPPLPSSTPAPNWLYVDHYGTWYQYALPLSSHSTPVRTLTEWPDTPPPAPPQVAVDQYGNVALASTEYIRLFSPPIVSFSPSHAKLILKLTPAITEVGISGADLADIEYDPNEDLWLLNNLGEEISMLRPPINKATVAALTLGFGTPGTKTAGFTSLIQARFDVNAALYVYAANAVTARLFKLSFPYAKSFSDMGLDLGTADFVDSSQWPPTARVAPSLLLGQYLGDLRSPHPGSPPSPPVDVISQFPQPFNPQVGHFPNAWVNEIVTALSADTYRYTFYTLDAGTGSLDAYPLPLPGHAKPNISLPCLAGPTNCSEKPEHLFLAP